MKKLLCYNTMKRFSPILLFVLPILLFVQCKKDITQQEDLRISTIALLAVDNNEVIANDFLAQTQDDDFRFELPAGLKGEKVFLQIVHNGSTVSIDGKETTGEKVEIELQDKIAITVKDQKGNQQTKALHISYTTADELTISQFSFKKEINGELLEDVVLTREGDAFVGTIVSLSKDWVASFETNATAILVNGVPQQSGVTSNNFANEVLYTFIAPNGLKRQFRIKITWLDSAVPHISINVEGGQEVVSKDVYLSANLSIDGKGAYTNFNGTTEIKGRGNSTWGYPKKPYRLKLTAKASILGLPEAKNWVLLANYLDPSLMCNTVAMRIGRDLQLPFTHHMIPVDLTINGEYRGSYVLTEQVEVHENRVNIGKTGVLLELDDYYDEEFKFRSTRYDLPAMIKEPELNNQNEIVPIQNAFNTMEELVFASTFPNNGYKELLDIEQFAKFFIVCFMTGNEEFNHPKSIYLHKKDGGKYTFGPLWDFDWAYGYEAGGKHFTNPSRNFFWNPSPANQGRNFVYRIFEDPAVKSAFKNHWEAYKSNHFNQLLAFIDDYAELIANSKATDVQKWGVGANFQAQVSTMKTYLQQRATYIDAFVQRF